MFIGRLTTFVTLFAALTGPLTVWAQGESYFEGCEAILTGTENANLDERLVEGATNPEKMARLMYDQGLLLSSLHRDTVLALMIESGFWSKELQSMEFVVHESRETIREAANTVQRLHALYTNPDAIRRLADGYLDQAILIAKGRHHDKVRSWAESFRLERFKSALEKNPSAQSLFEMIVAESIEQALLATAVHIKDSVARMKTTQHVLKNPKLVRHLTAIGIWAGLNLLYYVDYAFDDPHRTSLAAFFQPIFMFGSTLPAMFFGALTPYAIGGAKQLRASMKIEKIMAEGPAVKIYAIPRPEGRVFETRMHNLFASIKDGLTQTDLALNEACKKRMCELTPVQIASLGRLEIIQLDLLRDQIRHVMREEAITEQVEKLKATIARLKDQPAAYRAHVDLQRTLNDLILDLRIRGDARSTLVTELNDRVESLTKEIRELRKMPFTLKPSDLTEEEIRNNELLLARIDTDLSDLADLKINTEGLNARTQAARQALSQLESIRDRVQDDPRELQSVFDDILVELDRLSPRI